MTLHVPRFTAATFTFDNWGVNPGAAPGTSIVPGASDVEGSPFLEIASGANLAADICGFFLRIHGGSTGGTQKNHLLDVGVDPAGGTTWVPVISNIVCGYSALLTSAGSGHQFFFPLCIKAGSSVAVRIQGSNATAGTVRVGAKFWGRTSAPEMFPSGSFSETIGTITGTLGHAFTPGNAADGTYADLGVTTLPMWWWQLAYQVNNNTITAEYTYIDLAWGDASNKHIIHRIMHGGTANEEVCALYNPMTVPFAGYCPVPAGAHLYVRGRANNAPDTGYNAVAVGIGG